MTKILRNEGRITIENGRIILESSIEKTFHNIHDDKWCHDDQVAIIHTAFVKCLATGIIITEHNIIMSGM